MRVKIDLIITYYVLFRFTYYFVWYYGLNE
jgi:hypothetical protein